MRKSKAFIFGAGATGKALLPLMKEKYEIIGFLDNDPKKWGSEGGIPVYDPKAVNDYEYDMVVLATFTSLDPLTEQLMGMGVERGKIDSDYIANSLKSRISFLENLGAMFSERDIPGCVAESGVFQGDFAKDINRVFGGKKLYLFDTFEGFDARDVEVDKQNLLSHENAGHFGITSVDVVRAKLPHPENAVFRKGWFPETTVGVDERFCFVNIDFDLYQPILAALEYFYPRMVDGGVILVHEYFSEYWKGVKKAVDEFAGKTAGVKLFPVGDGLSIGVLK